MSVLARRARSRFFLRIAKVKRATERRCEYTMPLFSLLSILEAEGTLSDVAKRILEKLGCGNAD